MSGKGIWVVFAQRDYSEAIIGSADFEKLWILSRDKQISSDHFDYLVDYAKSKGFKDAKLRKRNVK